MAGRVMATAAMDDAHVYFGTASRSASETTSTFYCLDRSDGSEVWSQEFPNWLLACPVVTATRIFVGCDDAKLYCLDKLTGEEFWHFDTSGRVDSTPCVDTPGNCYFGSRDRFFYALDPDSKLLWSHFLKGGVAASPILDERDERLYIADLANTIYCFTLTGELVWSYKPRLPNIGGLRLRIYSSPALDNEQFLYLGSGDHHLYAVDRSNGLLFWREDTGAIVDSSPVISADEFLYVANRDGVLFKYLIEPQTADREVWQNDQIGQVFYGSPAIDAVNNIYICGAPPLEDPEKDAPLTQISYIDRFSGDILWSEQLPGYTDATPVLDHEGNVYLGTAAGKFVKMRGGGHALADSSWPTFHGEPTAHGRFEETFTQWLTKFDIPPEFAGSDRDSDEDGYRDYEEFVLGTNPKDILDHPRKAITALSPDGARLSFPLQIGIRAPYEVQTSSDLASWLTVTLTPPQLSFESMGETWQVQADLEAQLIDPKRFFRVFWKRFK